MLQGFWLGEKYVAEWGDPDRYFAGLKIFQSEKADYIIFTGGKLPWSDKPPESEVLKKQAIMDGIEPDRVLTTGIAANTAEEANQVKRLLRSILLTVLSLLHLVSICPGQKFSLSLRALKCIHTRLTLDQKMIS